VSFLRKRWPWLSAAALVVVAYLSLLLAYRIGGADPRPLGSAAEIAGLKDRSDINILFILIDTLRADHLGSYGYARETSPNLDRLAAGGVRFARQLSQSSWTKCSMASLWTGLYPARTGVTRFEHRLADEARMPAEILRDAGFRTVGLWRNGWVERYFGFGQGFEVYQRPVPAPLPPDVKRENPTLDDEATDDSATRAAAEFLRLHGRERWFLYLHMMDVHEYLYDEDSALFGTAYADVYDNAIRHEDGLIGEFLAQLAREGYLEKTLVVVAADHGESLGEHAQEGHVRRVYRETTEVPLILSFPFRLAPGLVVEERTQNVDLWPTVLELLGLPPLTAGIDGRSRVSEILAAARGEPAPEDGSPAFAHLDQTWGMREAKSAPTVAVVDRGFRYIRTQRGDALGEELFDATRDPRERRSVLAEEPEVGARLRGLSDSYLASRPPWGQEPPSLELDELQLNQLRALGYKVP